MIALLLVKFWKPLAVLALIAAAVIGFELWLTAHDHAVTEALVKSFEAQAADAKAKEAQRQAAAAKAATDAINARTAADKAADAAKDAQTEQRISSYEQQLAAAHRDCLADDADVDFILHDNKPADNSLGHH